VSGRRWIAVLAFTLLAAAAWFGWRFLSAVPEVVLAGNRDVVDPGFDPIVWQGCGAPRTVRPGERFLAAARLTNAGRRPWPHRGGPTRVAYRWRRTAGEPPDPLLAAVFDGQAPPGGELRTWLRVRAPHEPGTWALELVGVFGPVAWSLPAETPVCRTDVDVR
jgi:hypothetical protein